MTEPCVLMVSYLL